jgi:hypothetical protein
LLSISAGVSRSGGSEEEYFQAIVSADYVLHGAKALGRKQELFIEIEDNEQLVFLGRI